MQDSEKKGGKKHSTSPVHYIVLQDTHRVAFVKQVSVGYGSRLAGRMVF